MSESSKKGSKRGKKIELAMEASMRSTLTGLPHISEPPLVHGSPSEGVHSPNTMGSSIRSRNTRGPILCKGMSYGSEKKSNVQFNDLYLSIGDGSIKLSTYSGSLVREIVPIIYDDWWKVPEEIKKNLWILIKGTMKRVFQPAKESRAGAFHMIQEGALENVEAIFGLHVVPELQTGSIASRPGSMLTASSRFKAIIWGKGGHAAGPHKETDPVLAASFSILSLQQLVFGMTLQNLGGYLQKQKT